MRQFQVEYMGDAFAIMNDLRRIGAQPRGLRAVPRQMIEYPFPNEHDQWWWAGAVAFIMTVRVAEMGWRAVPWRLRARDADRKGLVEVDAVDRRHDRHIIAGQAVEIGFAVCAAQIGLDIDPLHEDRGRIVAPAVHFRYRNASTLKQAQHVILTAQRLHFLSGIAVSPDVHAHHPCWRFYRSLPGRPSSRKRADFDTTPPRGIDPWPKLFISFVLPSFWHSPS